MDQTVKGSETKNLEKDITWESDENGFYTAIINPAAISQPNLNDKEDLSKAVKIYQELLESTTL